MIYKKWLLTSQLLKTKKELLLNAEWNAKGKSKTSCESRRNEGKCRNSSGVASSLAKQKT